MSKREQTMDTLMDAALRLLGDRSESAISVRDIGAEAGANHGLIHHYFGSKDQLFRAALLRASRTFYEDQPQELQIAWIFRFFRERPEILRILARAMLDGPKDVQDLLVPPPERLAHWVTQLQGALDQITPDNATPINAYVLDSLGIAAIMGWFLFRPLLCRALNLPDNAEEEIERIIDSLDTLIRQLGGSVSTDSG